MAKRKKTLEQKKLADMHRTLYSLNNYSPVASIKQETPIAQKQPILTTTLYLKHDILKTSILTAAILGFQVLLFLLLTNLLIRLFLQISLPKMLQKLWNTLQARKFRIK